ncbi:phosphate signaling complex protein PhoU [Tessaracoccus sp. OS52]|uniref:phosphate signaling complex protein PhoU n=1 Tax=Tessaracoccus sp. OS52 TaxID=2886691 RepID=UPI001D0F584D|nr:phosphate signaling complex protein PhoU [Tessaracoccus sp. OS52]MCC2591971.1 phosphate signaling complex protein PhoU [Tessaracoccus sp. OS52]
MRASYHEELEGILDRLHEMSRLVEVAMTEATAALLTADLGRAESVISDDAKLDAMHEELEYKCLSLLALQAPVAGELRTIVSAIRVVFELARMGDLSAHIAKIARLRFPSHAVVEELEPNFQRMSEVCVKMVQIASASLRDHDASEAMSLASIDVEVDELRRDHFATVLDDNWQGTTAQAVDVALLGRYYERFADHAVAVARRVIYLVTGHAPEGEHWPNA